MTGPGGPFMPRPVASLPMYDWPEVRWATDALWTAIAERLHTAGIEAPAALDRERPSNEVWRDPGLVLSQTCGWPYATRLRDAVRLVATPVYDVEGCDGPLYSSAVVTRRGDEGQGVAALARRRVAFNASDSLSGFVALCAAMRAAGVDPAALHWLETGSHRASIRAVAEGQAELASIDAVCWALARDHEADAAARLAVVAWTPHRPGLPLITSPGSDMAAIRIALGQALDSRRTAEARAALHMTAAAVLEPSAYASIAALGV